MFADDIVICEESSRQAERSLEAWRETLEKRDIKVSRSKTRYLGSNETQVKGGRVEMQGKEAARVEEFKYLGSTVQRKHSKSTV